MSDLIYLDTALALASAAGALLREGEAHEAEFKSGPADLVTRYDRLAEACIVSGLRLRHPGHRVLAEEGGDQGGEAGAPRWIIDPLDGTTNFAHGLPFFSVSIACEVAGVVRAGVVLAPALHWTFAAVRGGGTTLNGRPVRVSAVTSLGAALLATGFPYDRGTSPDNNLAQFVALEGGGQVQGVRRVGSAALDLAMVAAGWMDGYWELKMRPWDLAAGLLLVEEAGGRTSDWRGGPVDLWRGEVAATNGLIHDELLRSLQRAGQSGFLTS